MTTEEIRQRTSNLETRGLAMIIAIAGALAFLWLQNTWGEIARLRDEIISLRDTVSQVYATQATMKTIEARVDRLEQRTDQKIDRLESEHERILNSKRGPPE